MQKTIILATLLYSTVVFADNKKSYNSYNLSTNQNSKEAKLYKNECSSCHMAYQTEFLPKRSWVKLMKQKSLEDHFGVDATLDEADRAEIEKFLVKNAGDNKRV